MYIDAMSIVAAILGYGDINPLNGFTHKYHIII